MRLATVLFLISLVALAQTPQPELRGTVTEFRGTATIPGAEVTVSEFVVVDGTVTRKEIAKVYTDARGVYSYRPGRLGEFFLEVKRDGYLPGVGGPEFSVAASEGRADLTAAQPVRTRDLMLLRPGRLTGRVVDEEGRPVAGVKLLVSANGIPANISPSVMSDAEGVFAMESMVPGPRVIRVLPSLADFNTIVETFTPEDMAVVDQDFEATYWPGGVSDPAQVVPLEIYSGATANAGTIRVRKIPYYRAHVTNRGDCKEGEDWDMFLRDPANATGDASARGVPCRPELLLRSLLPGQQILSIISHGSNRWALASITIRKENVEVPVTMLPAIDVPVQIRRDDGKALPPLDRFGVSLSSGHGSTSAPEGKADALGNLMVRNVLFAEQDVRLTLPPTLAVREVRYNYLPLTSPSFAVAPDAPLEIIVDEQPASLEISVRDKGQPLYAMVVAVKLPMPALLRQLQAPPFIFSASTVAEGKTRLQSLGEGEYRVAAIPSTTQIRDMASLLQLVSRGQRVSLKRGEQRTLELELLR